MSRQIITKGASGSLAVLISRISGLLRDMLLSRFIGGGAVMSAWVIAFRIPNTFRRFFGEGASSQALIPMMEHIIQREGIDNAKNDFGTIFASLGIVLSIISILIGAISAIVSPYFAHIDRIHITLCILPILMPYTIFICLSGICSGILNLFGKFFLPALSSVTLNIFIIIILLIFNYNSPGLLIKQVSWAVLFSGLIQLIIMFYLLKKSGFLPNKFVPGLLKNKAIKEFISLAIPGFIGAAAVQINTLVDSFIAIYLGNYAAPALYYSERIIYLPLGIFAVSIGNASLVTMTNYFVNNKIKELYSSLIYGINQILYITIPILTIFIIYRFEIISLIFSGDKFGAVEINETAWAMLFYSFGIPAFALVKVIVSAFYAQKKMKTPVKIALTCVVVNFCLNITLMHSMKQGGIALATTISSFLNCLILLTIFIKDFKISILTILLPISLSIYKSVVAAIISGIGSYILFNLIKSFNIIHIYDWRSIISLSFSGIIFLLIFLLINFLLKSKEQKEWLSLIRGKLK